LLVLGVAAARWCRRWPWTAAHGLGVVALLLACRGVLFYATHVETYLPSAACLAMLAATVTDPRSRSRDVTLWLVLAVLYHQTNVLIVPAILAVSKNLRRDLARVLLPAGGITFALYVLAWRIEGVERGLFSWMLTYAHADVPAWGRVENFSPSGLATLGASQLRMIAPVPESLVTIAGIAFWIALATLVAHHVRRLHGDPTAHRRLALTWLAVQLPFFLWWMPGDPDFFLATLLPLWMLAIAFVDERFRGLRDPVVGGLAVLLLAGNLATTGRILHASAGPAHAEAAALARSAPVDAVLVVDYGVQQQLLYHHAEYDAVEANQFVRRVREGMPPEWAGRPLVLGRRRDRTPRGRGGSPTGRGRVRSPIAGLCDTRLRSREPRGGSWDTSGSRRRIGLRGPPSSATRSNATARGARDDARIYS
jgi:hypothetical protein